MPANVGNQTVSILYHASAQSGIVNKRHKSIRQLGIYSGGRLSIVDGTHVSLSPLVCEISDDTHQVKVETTTTATGILVAANEYIVLRWAYIGATSDYMEILAVATPASNDLVVGKCNFGAGVLIGFDYGDTSYPRSTPNTQDLFLKVEPTEDTELKVRIRVGRVQNATQTFTVIDQKSTLFVRPGSNSRVYLLYVDTSDGTIKIDSSGTAAASPVAPSYKGKLVLAEITLASTDTNITVDKIKDVRNFVSTPIEPDGTTLVFGADGKLEVGVTVGVLGSWAVKSNNVVYQATTDGFVLAHKTGEQGLLSGYTDSSNPPTTLRQKSSTVYYNRYTDLTMPVRKNDYWKVTGADSVMWIPLGT